MDKRDIVLKSKKSHFLYVGIIAILVAVIGILVIPGRKEKSTPQVLTESLTVKSSFDSRYKTVSAKGGEVRFPLSAFDDSVQYFEYEGIRFFILKSNDGTIRAAFDACDVCFRSRRGYNQVGDYMQCNNCGQSFPEDKINVVLGGCNPSPLERAIEGEELVIKVSDIELGQRFF